MKLKIKLFSCPFPLVFYISIKLYHLKKNTEKAIQNLNENTQKKCTVPIYVYVWLTSSRQKKLPAYMESCWGLEGRILKSWTAFRVEELTVS